MIYRRSLKSVSCSAKPLIPSPELALDGDAKEAVTDYISPASVRVTAFLMSIRRSNCNQEASLRRTTGCGREHDRGKIVHTI